jgi:hypothetical protein
MVTCRCGHLRRDHNTENNDNECQRCACTDFFPIDNVCPTCGHRDVHYYGEGVGDGKIGCQHIGCNCTNFYVDTVGCWAKVPPPLSELAKQQFDPFTETGE